MDNNLTIEKFIENRWLEARSELETVDPRFVRSMQALFDAEKFRLVIPLGIPEPERRLAVAWSDVLESTFDISQALERIAITLERMEICGDHRLSRYYYEVWVQTVYALIEKIEGLIAYTCRLHGINRRKKKGYYALMEAEVKNEIERRRTAIVHGANRPSGGGTPITATVFTDEGMWEVAVFMGHKIIKNAISGASEASRYSVQEYFFFVTEMNNEALRRLGGVLETLDKDIVAKE